MNRIRVIPRTAVISVAILYFLMMSSFGRIMNTFNGLADPQNMGDRCENEPSVTNSNEVIAISVKWQPPWIFSKCSRAWRPHPSDS